MVILRAPIVPVLGIDAIVVATFTTMYRRMIQSNSIIAWFESQNTHTLALGPQGFIPRSVLFRALHMTNAPGAVDRPVGVWPKWNLRFCLAEGACHWKHLAIHAVCFCGSVARAPGSGVAALLATTYAVLWLHELALLVVCLLVGRERELPMAAAASDCHAFAARDRVVDMCNLAAVSRVVVVHTTISSCCVSVHSLKTVSISF